MGDQPVIAVDLMGGDDAPDVNIEACRHALSQGYRLLVLGTEDAVSSFAATENAMIEVCPEVVLPDEQAVRAIRSKPFSSMRRGLVAVKEGRANALVSGGSTGALVAGGALIVGRIPKVDKPCIATVMPTMDGKGVLFLDLGAAADVRPLTMVQFAHMGSIYAKEVMGRANPKVSLLNIGTEPEKGSAVIRNTYELLKNTELNFTGNIEARDVLSGASDVVVADGFSGNIFLKTCEGVMSFLMGKLKEEMSKGIVSKFAALMLRPAFKNVRDLLDYTRYGGAPLLGLKGCVIKCHGSSNSLAVFNGIRQAKATITKNVITRISSTLETITLEGEDH
jgi:glycerol-3-phosphate acyltransferase PlsX